MEPSAADSGMELKGRPLDVAPEEFAVVHVVRVVVRHRRLVLASVVVCSLLLVAPPLIRGRTFTATGSFMPVSSRGNLSRYAGLAAQFGIAVPGSDGSESPAFFADVLTSRDLMLKAVTSSYTVNDGGSRREAGLVELFKSRGRTESERNERALERLRRSISVRMSRETGMITYSVRTKSADLSGQIAGRLLELLQAFNVQRRQVLASAEAEFVADRMREAGGSLREAERDLAAFLVANRTYRGSPQLNLEYERLQRSVDMRQQVYTALAQAHDQARIDAVRSTPVIQVVTRPEMPVYPDRRRLLIKGILGLLLGAGLGTAMALGVEFARQVGVWPARKIGGRGDLQQARGGGWEQSPGSKEHGGGA